MVAVYTCRRNTYVTERTFCVSVTSTTPRRWAALLFTKGARNRGYRDTLSLSLCSLHCDPQIFPS